MMNKNVRQTIKRQITTATIAALISVGFFTLPAVADIIVNDVTKLNPITVSTVATPTSIQEVQNLIKNHTGPISIGGGRYSMGGQTATENAFFIDMRKMNKVVSFSPQEKTITVQSGATWRDIQNYIDPFNLSLEIMQTYNNFTVGGSLSVNAHGRYLGQGPIIKSVKSIKVVLANGDVIKASPSLQKDIFYGAIGGYGGLGLIVEATLALTDNSNIQRKSRSIPITEYKNYFLKNTAGNPSAVLHNGDIYPEDYTHVNAVTWYKTDKPVTVQDRIRPIKENYYFERGAIYWITELPLGHWVRQHLIDPWIYRDDVIVKRNYEASYDVKELEPASRDTSTYVLQEYFIPTANFDNFTKELFSVLKKNDVNVVNISIRSAEKDPGSLMAWARQDVFSFVLYYKQGVTDNDKQKVSTWTRQLIDAALSAQGTYYLPYQLQATKEQFIRAYPNAPLFFDLKKKLDPQNKFRNKLWDKYQ